MMRHFVLQLWRFGLVGAFGFLIDASILFLLVSCGVNPYLARGLSFPSAVTATWYLNRVWTFGVAQQRRDQWRQYRGYLAVQVIGALSNYACYAGILGARVIEASASGVVIALAIGAIVGLVVNFLGARFLVFLPGATVSVRDPNDR